MIPHNVELEVKLPAEVIGEMDFCKWAISKNPYRYIQVAGPDQFYRRGEEVVRHRIPPDEAAQLTIKKRKSTQSIKDRSEVDLELSLAATPDLVKNFLELAGFIEDIRIYKQAKIFWFKNKKEEIIVSFYSAQKEVNGALQEPKKCYIEIEVLKGSDVTIETGKSYLRKWTDELNTYFKLDLKPLNESLYEVFNAEQK